MNSIQTSPLSEIMLEKDGKIRTKSSRAGDYVVVAICVFLILIYLAPFVNIISRSLSSPNALVNNRVSFWPVDFTLDSYVYVFIPAASKVPEAAVRYINWLAKPEVYRFLQFGEEGKNHKIVNGLPATIPADGPTIQNSVNNIDYTISMNGIWLGDEETTDKAIANGYTCDPEYIVQAIRCSLNDAEAGLVVPVTLSVAGPYTEDLKAKGEEGTCNAVRAPEGQFDAIWDAFIAEWRASGADEIIAERAAKYVDPF